MSLKAYNGMKTDKGFSYLEKQIKKNLSNLKEASLKKLEEAYAKAIVRHVDFQDLASYFRMQCHSGKDFEEIKKLEIEKSTTLFSFIFQCAKILSKSNFINDFIVDLPISIEQRGKRLLVYPGIHVEEHRDILLSFLDDWYAQNQSDPDEKVPKKEWKLRCKDWDSFSEVQGLESKIHIFNPEHHWNNLVSHHRGKELVQGVLSKIDSDESRISDIQKNNFILMLMERSTNTDSRDRFFEALDYTRTKKGKEEYEIFKKSNPVFLKKIDETTLEELIWGKYKILNNLKTEIGANQLELELQ